jgi:hypothetical protein
MVYVIVEAAMIGAFVEVREWALQAKKVAIATIIM